MLSKKLVKLFFYWWLVILPFLLIALVYNFYFKINIESISIHFLVNVSGLLILDFFIKILNRFNTVFIKSINKVFLIYVLIICFYSILNFTSNFFWGEHLGSALFLEYLSKPSELTNLVRLRPLIFVLFFIIYIVIARYLIFAIRNYNAASAKLNTATTVDQNDFSNLPLAIFIFLTPFFCVALLLIVYYSKVLYALMVIIGLLLLIFISNLVNKTSKIILYAKLFNIKNFLGIATRFSLVFYWIILGIWINTREYVLNQEPFWCFFNNIESLGPDYFKHRKEILFSEKSIIDHIDFKKVKNNSPNLILIIVDALRADRLGIYGYSKPNSPFIDSLFYEGKISKINLALSTCANSYCGILSTLSSKNYKDLSHANFKLTDYLNNIGYTINFIVSGSHQNWSSLGSAYKTTHIDNYLGENIQGFSTTDDRKLLEGLFKLKDYSEKPNFFYFHLMSTHEIGVKLPEYQKYSLPLYGLDREETIYDNSVYQADRIIKKIFSMLHKKGYLENSFMLITSDHGENIEKSYNTGVGHSWSLENEETRIPILVYDSKKENIQLSNYGTLTDIAPTFIDKIGKEVPEIWEGKTLLTPQRSLPYTTFHEGTRYPFYRAVVIWEEKQVLKFISSKNNKKIEFIFDILNDPSESNNLINTIDFNYIRLANEYFLLHW